MAKNQFVKKKCDMWHVTYDMWHMKCDRWNVTHDTWWHVTCYGMLILSQKFTSLGLMVCVLCIWRLGGKVWLTHWMNEWMKKMWWQQIQLVCPFFTSISKCSKSLTWKYYIPPAMINDNVLPFPSLRVRSQPGIRAAAMSPSSPLQKGRLVFPSACLV